MLSIAKKRILQEYPIQFLTSYTFTKKKTFAACQRIDESGNWAVSTEAFEREGKFISGIVRFSVQRPRCYFEKK